MNAHRLVQSLIAMFALGWELRYEERFTFCYRMRREPVRNFFGRIGQPQ
jgi:hypothetical protein